MMEDLLETYNDHSLSTEEKAYLTDIQYELWHRLGASGLRLDKGITSLVCWASGLYTGEHNDDYDLIGLGKSMLCVEVTVTFKDKAPDRGMQLIERGDTSALGAEIERQLKEILKRN